MSRRPGFELLLLAGARRTVERVKALRPVVHPLHYYYLLLVLPDTVSPVSFKNPKLSSLRKT